MYGDTEKLDDNLIVAAGNDGDIFIVQADDDNHPESALLLTREQALKLREFITKQEEE